MKRLVIALSVLALVGGMMLATPQAYAHHRVRMCHGHKANIRGNRKGNTLVGTPRADVIWAGKGNDRVFGRKGNDIICGGRGHDVIDGMRGLDQAYGGGGNDWCLAPKMREHRHYHHKCEVHVGAKHVPRPQTRTTTIATAAAGLSSALAGRDININIWPGNCGTHCDAGVPSCQTGQISWQNETWPRVSLTDSGYIAMEYIRLVFDKNNGIITDQGEYESGWQYYTNQSGGPLAPGTYSLQPVPLSANVPSTNAYGTDGPLYVAFSYSTDEVNWTPVLFDYAQSIDNALSGYPGLVISGGDCVT